MHNLKIEIDENLKEQVYKYAGFGFSHSMLSDQELNYENIFKAIDPGPEFTRICSDLELDTNVAVEYVKKYIIYLIIEDVQNFKFPSKQTLKSLKGQEIKGQKIEDIIDEIFFKTPIDLFNTLGYIKDFFSTAGDITELFTPEQIKSKMENDYIYEGKHETLLTKESKKKWKENSKKTGSFYELYKSYATKKSTASISLVKRYGKITDFNEEFKNKQIHFERFIKALELAEFNSSQDIWSFEYKTYLFMLDKIRSYKDIDTLEEEHFLVLASLILVGDIRLKLLLMDTLFKNDSWSHYKNKLSEILLLSFIIIPYFKEFIKENLMVLIPEAVFNSNSTSVNDNHEMKVVDLKKQLYIYQTLKGENCYHGESLAYEFGINIKDEIAVTEGLKIAWKHIEKVSKTIEKSFNNIFHALTDHLSEFESFFKCYNQDELPKTFKIWLEGGVFKATQEYRYKLMKNNNNNSETKDLSDIIFIGKKDEETNNIKLEFERNWKRKQKKLNKKIGEEFAQLGIDINKLKAISKKYNCSITIEPENVINKRLHNVDR